jgi:ABC-2 type transport system permease protein
VAEGKSPFLVDLGRRLGGFFGMILPRRAAALANKEVHHILRDPYTLGMSIGLPVMMLMLFGEAINFDVADVKVAVLDQDNSTDSRMLIDTIRGSGYFVVSPSHGNPEEDLSSERAKAVVVIPAGFQREVGRGEVPKAQLLVDGSDNATAGVVAGYMNGVAGVAWQHILEREAPPGPDPPITFVTQYLFNKELNSRWFMIPGLLVIIIGLLAVLMTALTVAREWENGSMEMLLTTPARPMDIILGKVAPYVGLGLMAVGLVYGAGRLVFHVPFRGSLLLLLLGSLLFLFVSLSQGLLISVATRNQQVAFQLSMMSAMLPTMLLSGFIFPVESMPIAFRIITCVLPPRWFMVISRGLFLKGAGPIELALPFLVLGLMCFLFVMFAVKKFKTDLEP